MRKDYIKELEKSLNIIKGIPLRHKSWNDKVYYYSLKLEQEIKEERLLNKPVMYHEFYKNKIVDYMLLNKGNNWLTKIVREDLANELEAYAKHLGVKLTSSYSHYTVVDKLRYDTIDYKEDRDYGKVYFRQSLCDFCIKGHKALTDYFYSEKEIARLNSLDKQEYLQIGFIDHHRKNYKKGKTLVISKEDILDWKEKVEEIFEEGYTDMDFDYRICLPHQPEKQYYYKIRNPKKENWEKKLMKEVKEENKNVSK